MANTGDKTIPDLAITIFTASNASTSETQTSTTGSNGSTGTSSQGLPQAQGSFSVRSDQPGLAIPFRPVWILEEGYPEARRPDGLCWGRGCAD